jgi:hypothetical protein
MLQAYTPRRQVGESHGQSTAFNAKTQRPQRTFSLAKTPRSPRKNNIVDGFPPFTERSEAASAVIPDFLCVLGVLAREHFLSAPPNFSDAPELTAINLCALCGLCVFAFKKIYSARG